VNVTDKAGGGLAVLTLEDDAAPCDGIKLTLAADDRQFEPCLTIGEAKAAPRDGSPDLFMPDISLPDGSELDFCAELRSAGHTAPVLMLTANDTELDMVAGLKCGA
jgi:DNA-binding response OmpR family regulator